MVAQVVGSSEQESRPGPFGGPPQPAPPQPCPELACLRGHLSDIVLAEAERRAEHLGTGADRVLIANGAVREERFVRLLAASLGLAFEDLDDTPRAACPLGDDRLVQGAALGVIPVTTGAADAYVVAPRHLAARTLTALAARDPDLVRRFRVTTTARLDRFAVRGARRTLTDRATNGLRARWPTMSAARLGRARHTCWLAALATAGCAAVLAPTATLFVLEVLLAPFFLAWLALRLGTAAAPGPVHAHGPPLRDRDLPVYTVVAALYREARSADGLIHAIARLDYPPEKLDLILALEEDDHDTREAVAAYRGPLPLRVIAVPDGRPRTKPRALNTALPFARGDYLVVYDAEDRPEPEQLRCALRAFAAAAGGRLACVQARLAIDNTDDGWLARGIMAQTPQAFL